MFQIKKKCYTWIMAQIMQGEKFLELFSWTYFFLALKHTGQGIAVVECSFKKYFIHIWYLILYSSRQWQHDFDKCIWQVTGKSNGFIFTRDSKEALPQINPNDGDI